MMLESERLLLREFAKSDWEAVLAYQSDPQYLQYYRWTHRTARDVQSFLQTFIDQQQKVPRHHFQFAVILKAGGGLIGNCGIRKSTPDDHQAEIGFEFAPEHWGRGYATESACLLLAFGFEELNMHRIWARCLAENQRSSRVLRKLGMQLEGRLRQNEWFKDRWWDTLLYGMLEDEWRQIPARSHRPEVPQRK
jgi:ribosomal-protein-alanine N-acetyltransferase